MKKVIQQITIQLCLAFVLSNTASAQADSVKFICAELLGRPTDKSITVNMCTDKDAEVFIEYGSEKANYTNRSEVINCNGGTPFNIVLKNLEPGANYFYQVQYRLKGSSQFKVRNEHSFKTAKSKGTSFTFAVEADPHMDSNTDPDLYKLTLLNILNNAPDFLLDLGDTFMSEKLKNPSRDSITIRHLLLRSFFDLACHSVPLYLVIGNHEGELGWLINGSPNSVAVIAANTRLKYYPNPLPDEFYSGNTANEPFVGLRQNYYSWEWGNALFVVLDPYWYTMKKPNKNVDNWSWTLGLDQYLWFKNVLEKSSSKFKFVFAHQVIGGGNTEGRGGTEAVPFYEMGGQNADGSDGFIINRPGWELPIHQLMVQNHVNIYFHGHDHFYDKQELDGIIYQEVPQPGNPNYKTAQSAADFGYITGKIIPCAGFLKITVNDSSAVVDYVRSYLPAKENSERVNGMTDYSYTILSNNKTSVENETRIPEQYQLMQNYPNPFNPNTVISYKMPKAGYITLKVYDVLGQEIETLVNGFKNAGIYHTTFMAKNNSLSNGVYFYRITIGEYSDTKKMLLIK